MTHTHASITDPHLRRMFANELLVLRRSMRRIGQPINSEWVSGIRLGLETAFRRMDQQPVPVVVPAPDFDGAGTA